MKLVSGLPNQIDVKASILECILAIKKEVDDFNKDLQQISQRLSYQFLCDLHNLCLKLLWKWHEERAW